MTQRIGKLGLCAILAVVALGSGTAFAQNSLSIDNAMVDSISVVTVPIRMTNDCDVEGHVIAVGYDTATISVVGATTDGTVTDAAGDELVVVEIFDPMGGFTIGTVLDFNAPFDGQTIAPGAGQVIATFDVMPDIVLPLGDPCVDTTASFVDGTFNNPPLDNIIVCGGLSIGAAQGLGLNPGVITICPPPPDELCIPAMSSNMAMDQQICVPITIDAASGDIQGYVLAITHDAGVVGLDSIQLGAAAVAAGAEFSVADAAAPGGDGGTLAVVLDFNPPFAPPKVIPAGDDIELAVFKYSCNTIVTYDPAVDPVPPTVCGDLEFTDNTLGNPPLSNVIVVGGLSLNPTQKNGQICCEPVPVVPPSQMFACGMDNGDGTVGPVTGAPGETVEVCFFYKSPDANVQGFQMALTFDCNLCCVQGSFSIEGTILEAVGAEFVAHSCDNDPNDGDGCELTIGILLDALPPFERQTAPQTSEFLAVGCIDFEIKDTAPCNTCLGITFTNGVNGGEGVPIENIMVINNESVQGFMTMDCEVCVELAPEFIRGDCNGDTKVDLADAATVLSQQFQGFPVPCLDACDANDDGKINLADTVFLLNFLFDSGDAPPDPGPDLDQGPDPTDDDDLDCEDGRDPCP